jgi:hypothetical protein
MRRSAACHRHLAIPARFDCRRLSGLPALRRAGGASTVLEPSGTCRRRTRCRRMGRFQRHTSANRDGCDGSAGWSRAGLLGRQSSFVAGLHVSPIRRVLYSISDTPYWLVSVQLLDSIGAGI